jgi:cytochrome c-type biogenesis protein CcmH/NrfF
MFSFHMALEGHNEQANSPADMAQQMMAIRYELLQGKSTGDIHDHTGAYLGSWSLEYSKEEDIDG